ncbi:MAG: hypothetical protein R3E32_18775 [Chitinophagales bacterium]
MEQMTKIADFITHRLSPEEAAMVELRIAEDAEWKEEEAFQREVLFTAIEVKKMQLRKQFAGIEAKLQKKYANNLSTSIDKIKTSIKEHVEYSVEQLKELFAPVPHYQPLLAMPTRAGSLEVMIPQNGIDCTDEGLQFELTEASDETLELSIENNQCEEVYTQEILPNTFQFIVPFAAKDYPPGRYYWKLMVEDEMIISEFFVGKDLISTL